MIANINLRFYGPFLEFVDVGNFAILSHGKGCPILQI